MKKVVLFLTLCFSAFCFDASAIGIEFSFKKGIREWSPSGTTADCIGNKKMCEFKIKVDVSLLSIAAVEPLSPGQGGIFNDNGHITIVLPEATLQDRDYGEIFDGSVFSLSADHVFTDAERDALGAGCPQLIPAGDYTYTIQDGVIIINI